MLRTKQPIVKVLDSQTELAPFIRFNTLGYQKPVLELEAITTNDPRLTRVQPRFRYFAVHDPQALPDTIIKVSPYKDPINIFNALVHNALYQLLIPTLATPYFIIFEDNTPFLACLNSTQRIATIEDLLTPTLRQNAPSLAHDALDSDFSVKNLAAIHAANALVEQIAIPNPYQHSIAYYTALLAQLSVPSDSVQNTLCSALRLGMQTLRASTEVHPHFMALRHLLKYATILKSSVSVLNSHIDKQRNASYLYQLMMMEHGGSIHYNVLFRDLTQVGFTSEQLSTHNIDNTLAEFIDFDLVESMLVRYTHYQTFMKTAEVLTDQAHVFLRDQHNHQFRIMRDIDSAVEALERKKSWLHAHDAHPVAHEALDFLENKTNEFRVLESALKACFGSDFVTLNLRSEPSLATKLENVADTLAEFQAHYSQERVAEQMQRLQALRIAVRHLMSPPRGYALPAALQDDIGIKKLRLAQEVTLGATLVRMMHLPRNKHRENEALLLQMLLSASSQETLNIETTPEGLQLLNFSGQDSINGYDAQHFHVAKFKALQHEVLRDEMPELFKIQTTKALLEAVIGEVVRLKEVDAQKRIIFSV